MSNKFVVAIDIGYINNIRLMPANFKIGENEVYIHYAPITQIKGEEVVGNYDLCIHFESRDFTRNEHHLLVNSLSFPASGKSYDYLRFLKFKKDCPEVSLSMPKSYCAITSAFGMAELPLAEFPLADATPKVVIKPSDGARGARQVLIPKHQVGSFLADVANKTINEMREHYPDAIITKDKHGNDEDKIPLVHSRDDLNVSDYLSDIIAEYRILVSGDKIYGRPRTIKDNNGYRQANLDLDEALTGNIVEYLPVNRILPKAVVEDLKKFCDYMDFRFGSIDLYERETHGHAFTTFGIFEWQCQYGFLKADPKFIEELNINFIEYCLKSAGLITDEKPTEEKNTRGHYIGLKK